MFIRVSIRGGLSTVTVEVAKILCLEVRHNTDTSSTLIMTLKDQEHGEVIFEGAREDCMGFVNRVIDEQQASRNTHLDFTSYPKVIAVPRG